MLQMRLGSLTGGRIHWISGTLIMRAVLLIWLTATCVAGETYTLDRAVDVALSESPDAKIAEARMASAQAVLTQAQSAFQPKAMLESSYLRTNQPVSVFGFALNQRSYSPGLDFNHVPDADNWNTRALMTMPLYAGGANVARKNAAEAGLAASGHGVRAVRQMLAYEVARTWLMVHKTRSLQGAAQSAVASFETNFSLAQKREKAGTVLRADVLDVEVRLAQAREDLVQVRNANTLGCHALRNLMGIETGEVEISSGAPVLKRPGAEAVMQRAELLAALERERAMEAGIVSAKAGWKPEVNAFGSVEHNRGAEFDGNGNNYTVGVMARWNVWDGRQTRGRVAEAVAGLEAARQETRKLRLGVDLEVQQAKLAVKDAEERLAVTKRGIELAEESVKLTRDRYEQGLSLTAQLIDAETALTGARVRRVEAETNLSVAVAGWRKALGLSIVE
jgi:outer membrane protein